VRLERRAPVRILVARRVHNPIRRVDLLEHTVFEIELVGGWPEQDAPRPAHPQVGLGLDDDPALVRGVPTAPRLGVDPVPERGVGRGVHDAFEADVALTHRIASSSEASNLDAPKDPRVADVRPVV
jgi:hypothetical protein